MCALIPVLAFGLYRLGDLVRLYDNSFVPMHCLLIRKYIILIIKLLFHNSSVITLKCRSRPTKLTPQSRMFGDTKAPGNNLPRNEEPAEQRIIGAFTTPILSLKSLETRGTALPKPFS